MIKKPFIIYQSSAGSGKTYTLAKNYIRLSLKSKNYFKKILAVTFTNKAAEEMKIRILDMIDSISNGEEKELKFKPKTKFKDGIKLTFEWYRNNQSFYKSLLQMK